MTTACVSARGLPDDCDELTILRQFRDGYMRGLQEGDTLIDLYYDIAPQVVAAINAQENAKQVYDHLYSVIRTCVEHIKNGRNEQALGIYVEMVQKLAGHADIQTTARYDRRPEEAKRRAAGMLHVPYRRRAA